MACRILVIDDATPIHTLVKTHLSQPRFEILSAFDGKSGLAAALASKPDLILLDVDMPAVNGFEVCRRLKADPSTQSIPVLFLTAAATTDQKIRGLDIGGCDYITKPFDPNELRARIRSAFRTKRVIDELAQNVRVDPLTTLFDRNYFEARFDADLAAAQRSGQPIGCLLVDIDHMTVANTSFGRQAGDGIIHAVAGAIAQACRREDVVCRFGGDEFAILTTGTDAASLNQLAERVCGAVRSAALIYPDRMFKVTASIGMALSRPTAGTSIVAEALDALGRAKQAGGNCVRKGCLKGQLQLAV